jgi:hypothetical protein
MNNLELAEWLLKVRDALAEPDEVQRNSKLGAADRFLKGSSQRSLTFRRTRIGEGGSGISPGRFVQPKQVVAPRGQGID